VSLHRRGLLRGGAAAAVAALAGCASAPTNYFRLAVVPGPVNNGPALKIAVRSINIPGYLDQNGIAKAGGAYEISTFANDIWAEPLNDMLQDVAVQELAQRLPASVVIGSGGSIASATDLVIEANVLRFDPDSTGLITLTVQLALKSGQDYHILTVQSFSAAATPAGADVTNTVATMSALWGKFADQLALLCAQQSVNLASAAASQAAASQ
jgi:uncharacterized lipoprotein YmbA